MLRDRKKDLNFQSIEKSDSRHCCDVNEKQEEDLKQDNKCLMTALRSE
jgi:hypothetical protein